MVHPKNLGVHGAGGVARCRGTRQTGSVDSYLQIAVTVLQQARRPLGPRAILTLAYQNDLVPPQLHGKTQHKTLQARISEDIIQRREHSPFFRPAPGQFFLRDFLTDTSIPEAYRVPMATRRRVRDLIRGPVLSLDPKSLKGLSDEHGRIERADVLSLLQAGHVRYGDPKTDAGDSVFLWSFVCVVRANSVLSYRQGRYRETRDAFALRRTIGFSTLVHQHESTLFNVGDLGIVDSGVHATMLDLDIPQVGPTHVESQFSARLRYFLWPSYKQSRDLVAVIDFDCPAWFEPMKRRLAINDLHWLDWAARINDLDDFDPWSRSVMLEHSRLRKGVTAQSS